MNSEEAMRIEARAKSCEMCWPAVTLQNANDFSWTIKRAKYRIRSKTRKFNSFVAPFYFFFSSLYCSWWERLNSFDSGFLCCSSSFSVQISFDKFLTKYWLFLENKPVWYLNWDGNREIELSWFFVVAVILLSFLRGLRLTS